MLVLTIISFFIGSSVFLTYLLLLEKSENKMLKEQGVKIKKELLYLQKALKRSGLVAKDNNDGEPMVVDKAYMVRLPLSKTRQVEGFDL